MTELLLVTSVVRQAGRDDASGLVRVIERESGRVVARTLMRESDYRERESNPRGGVRGARGASVFGDRLVIANSERLFVLDSSWKTCAELTDPLFGGIHDILADEGGIWVTSTAADLMVRVDWNGNVIETWDWRADGKLLRRLGHLWLPRPFGTIDHRDPGMTRDLVTNAAHINAVAPCPGGILVCLGRVLPARTYAKRRIRGLQNRLASRIGSTPRHEPDEAHKKHKVVGAPITGCRSAIVRISGGRAELVLERHPTTVPNHNIIQLGDWLVFNDTNRNATTAVSLTSTASRSVVIPGGPAFARGLAHLSGMRFLAGSQEPAALYEVDLEQERIVRMYEIEGMKNECIYGIVPLPPAFGIPTSFQL